MSGCQAATAGRGCAANGPIRRQIHHEALRQISDGEKPERRTQRGGMERRRPPAARPSVTQTGSDCSGQQEVDLVHLSESDVGGALRQVYLCKRLAAKTEVVVLKTF